MSDFAAPSPGPANQETYDPRFELRVPFRNRETLAADDPAIEGAYDRLILEARTDSQTTSSVRRLSDGSYAFVFTPHRADQIPQPVRELGEAYAKLINDQMEDERSTGKLTFGRKLPPPPKIATPGVGIVGADGLAQPNDVVVMYKRGGVFTEALTRKDGPPHVSIQDAMKGAYTGLREGYESLEADLPERGQFVYVERGAAKTYNDEVYAHYDHVLQERAANRNVGGRIRSSASSTADKANKADERVAVASTNELAVVRLPDYYLRSLPTHDPLVIAHNRVMELTKEGTVTRLSTDEYDQPQVVLTVPKVTAEMVAANNQLQADCVVHFTERHYQAQMRWGVEVPKAPFPQMYGRSTADIGGVVVPTADKNGRAPSELGPSRQIVTFGYGRRHLDPLIRPDQQEVRVSPDILQQYGIEFGQHVQRISANAPPGFFATVARLTTAGDRASLMLNMANPERLHGLPPEVKLELMKAVQRIPDSEPSQQGPYAGQYTLADKSEFESHEPLRQKLGDQGINFVIGPLERRPAMSNEFVE